ncbi:hypothetical protein [Deinococcus radiophilus]|uniref:hypothetical protein n=1 Tax=Deinococcus radiophilus TaxID=32062 RepID=UPI001E339A80|nr:hypothetical protein [Deinococcus radiophilus]UFA50723.1 hypothetical protein LMT64_02115 [Deinococcus radiophilus]
MTSVPTRATGRRASVSLGRVLRIVAALLLALLGLGLAAFSISRFGALGAGAPLWLQAVASGELLLGQLVFGAGYAAWDEFGRALVQALLASLCLGLAAGVWPRRRLRVQPDSPYSFSYHVDEEWERGA